MVVKSQMHLDVWREALRAQESGASEEGEEGTTANNSTNGSSGGAGAGASGTEGAGATAAVPTTVPTVTALEWDAAGERVFSGDDQGTICATTVPSARSLVKSPLFGAAVLLRMPLPLVQLCYSPHGAALLLASDTAKTVVVDLATARSTQIGRQLRNGPLGACFHPARADVALLARPNLRIWEAAVAAARVCKTIKFDQAAAAPDALRTLGRLVCCGSLVVSYARDGIAVLDPDKPALLESITGPAAVEGVAVVQATHDLYVLTEGGTVQRLYQRQPLPPPPPPVAAPTEDKEEKKEEVKKQEEAAKQPEDTPAVPVPEEHAATAITESTTAQPESTAAAEPASVAASETETTAVPQESAEQPQTSEPMEPAEPVEPMEPIHVLVAVAEEAQPQTPQTPQPQQPQPQGDKEEEDSRRESESAARETAQRSQTVPVPASSDEGAEAPPPLAVSPSLHTLTYETSISKILPLGDEIVPIKRRRGGKKRRSVQVAAADTPAATPRAVQTPTAAEPLTPGDHSPLIPPITVPAAAAEPLPSPSVAGSLPVLESAAAPSLQDEGGLLGAEGEPQASPVVTPRVVRGEHAGDDKPGSSSSSSSSSSSFSRSLSFMKKKMTGTMKELAKRPGRSKARHAGAAPASDSPLNFSTPRTPQPGAHTDLFPHHSDQEDGATSAPETAPETTAAPAVLPPEESDRALPFRELTARVFRLVHGTEEEEEEEEVGEGRSVVRQWLALWLHRAGTADLAELQHEPGADTADAELQLLTSTCFDLGISGDDNGNDSNYDKTRTETESEATTEADGSGHEQRMERMLERYGRWLPLSRCFARASEWRSARCCRRAVALAPQFHAGYGDVARAVRARDFAGAAARLRLAGDACLFLAAVPLLDELDHAQTVRLAVAMHPAVTAWHVAHVLAAPAFYRDYLPQYLAAHGTPDTDAPLYVELARMLLADDEAHVPPPDAAGAAGAAGAPAPGHGTWKNGAELLALLDTFEGDPDTQTQLGAEFRRAGFWPGVLALHTARGETGAALALVLAMDDAARLRTLMAHCRDTALWHTAVQHVVDRDNNSSSKSSEGNEGNSNEGGHEITLTLLVESMLDVLGAQATAEVLAAVPGCAEQLPAAALQSVLRVGKLSLVDERALVRQLLSTVDGYLWARRSRVCSAALGTVLAGVADAGADAGARLAALPFVAARTAAAGQRALGPAFDMQRPMRVFHDENETGHWGAACCLGVAPGAAHPHAQDVCAFCALPLLAPVAPSTATAGSGLSPARAPPQRNIAVMPGCGHAFHQACLAGTDGCIVCLRRNMSRTVVHRHPL